MNVEDLMYLASLIGGRYFISAGLAFFIFYIAFKGYFARGKIQQKYPRLKDYSREIIFSIITIFIFSATTVGLVYNSNIRPFTTLYTDLQEHSWWYFFAAFPLMMLMHDTYFYWTHRLMHHPQLFKIVHLLHHRSVNPSPWAAYAFHPLEALVETGIFVLFVFTIPVHPYHLGLYFLFMIIYNVYGHLGFELYPHGFQKTIIGKWINTSVNHNMHHQFFKGNYALYFTFWDRMMGTLHPDYDRRFDEVTLRAGKPKGHVPSAEAVTENL